MDKLKAEVTRLTELNEDLRTQVDTLDRENRSLKTSTRVVPV